MRRSRPAAVLSVSAVLPLSGCSPSGGSEDSGYAGPARPAAAGEWERGPAEPVRHKPYPYDIDTHRGVKWAEFGGRWWVLDSVHPGGAAVRGGPAPRHGGRLAGHMTLTGPDTVFFEAAGMPAMEFVPAGEEPPGCA